MRAAIAANAATLNSACFECVAKIMFDSRTEMLSDTQSVRVLLVSIANDAICVKASRDGQSRIASYGTRHICYATASCDAVSSSPCRRPASAECSSTRLIVKSFGFPHELTNPFASLFGFSLNRKLSLLPPPPHESFRAMKRALAREKQASLSISTGSWLDPGDETAIATPRDPLKRMPRRSSAIRAKRRHSRSIARD